MPSDHAACAAFGVPCRLLHPVNLRYGARVPCRPGFLGVTVRFTVWVTVATTPMPWVVRAERLLSAAPDPLRSGEAKRCLRPRAVGRERRRCSLPRMGDVRSRRRLSLRRPRVSAPHGPSFVRSHGETDSRLPARIHHAPELCAGRGRILGIRRRWRTAAGGPARGNSILTPDRGKGHSRRIVPSDEEGCPEASTTSAAPGIARCRESRGSVLAECDLEAGSP